MSNSVVNVDSRSVLNLEKYTPFFLAMVNNKLSSGASAIYREKYNVGIVEWRVISMVAIEHGINAQRICDKIGLDKGATSKALKSLFNSGYLQCVASETDKRLRKWWLNEKGFELHDRILSIAIEREKLLVEGIDAKDMEIFREVMLKMRNNIKKM